MKDQDKIEDDGALRRRRIRRLIRRLARHPWRNLFLLLVLLTIAVFSLRPLVMPRYAEWKTGRDLGKARAAAVVGDHQGARDWAYQVIRAERGREEEALPILLRAQVALDDPRIVQTAGIIWYQRPDADEELRLEAWKILGERLPTASLIGSWFSLEEPRRFQSEILQPFLRRCVDESNPQLSRQILAMLPPLQEPELIESRLRILADSRSALERDDFARGLATAILLHPERSASWLELLERADPERFGPREFEQVQRYLEGFPEEQAAAGLQRARLRMFELPNDRDAIFLETYQRYAGVDPWATARWCRAVGEDDWARDTLDLAEPATDPEKLELQVELLLAGGLREQAAELLEAAVGDRAASWRQAFWKCWAARLREEASLLDEYGRMLTDVGGDQLLRVSWSKLRRLLDEILRGARVAREAAQQQAVEMVSGSSDLRAAIDLARAAGRRGLDELARDAWAVAFAEGAGPLPLYESVPNLLPSLERAGRERAMLAVCRTVVRLEPGNDVVRSRSNYLSLTNGLADAEALIEDMKALIERRPELALPKTTLALAHLLLDQPERAEEITDALELDWYEAPDGARALRIAILRAVGRREEAELLGQGFRMGDLLPSEERIFRALLADKAAGLDESEADPALRAPTPATAATPEKDEEEEGDQEGGENEEDAGEVGGASPDPEKPPAER